MRPLSLFLFLAAALHGQEYLCSTIRFALTSQVPASFSCGAKPSSIQVTYNYTVNGLNTHTGAIYDVSHPVGNINVYCGGLASTCPWGVSEATLLQRPISVCY
jgi:hypothetical protein